MIETSPMSVEEAVETLTGFEEQEIAKRFGAEVGELLDTSPTTGMRAIATVVIARDLTDHGAKDPKNEAYQHVMGMPLKQLADFFPDAPYEPLPDEPKTPAGEDGGSLG